MEIDQQASKILINGELAHEVSIHDRGLAFGDGLFETMRFKQGRVPLIDYHWARLHKGLLALRFTDIQDLMARIKENLASYANLLQAQDGVIKLVVTRGESQTGYRVPQDEISPNIICSYRRAPAIPKAPVKVFWCEQRLSDQGVLAGIKHLNRLEYVLATMELDEHKECFEGLLMDHHGNVVEGTRTNLIITKNSQLFTPQLDRCGVHGVMLAYLKDHFEIQEAKLKPHDVREAEQLILVNNVLGCVLAEDKKNSEFAENPLFKEMTQTINKFFE